MELVAKSPMMGTPDFDQQLGAFRFQQFRQNFGRLARQIQRLMTCSVHIHLP